MELTYKGYDISTYTDDKSVHYAVVSKDNKEVFKTSSGLKDLAYSIAIKWVNDRYDKDFDQLVYEYKRNGYCNRDAVEFAADQLELTLSDAELDEMAKRY